jgi:CheY-like chemotaxis protein
VEDDDEVAALVTEMFEHLGYGVTRTASAAAALGALADGRSIDLVFSDVMMPGGMNGVELAREIHNRRRGLPILLASAYAQSARDGAEAAGVRLLAKPFGLEDLAGALAGALPQA